MNLPNATPSLEGLSQSELLQKREELLIKAKGDPAALSDEEIELMCSIHAQLRRRTSGPPSTTKKRAASGPQPELESLL